MKDMARDRLPLLQSPIRSPRQLTQAARCPQSAKIFDTVGQLPQPPFAESTSCAHLTKGHYREAYAAALVLKRVEFLHTLLLFRVLQYASVREGASAQSTHALPLPGRPS